MFQANSDHPLYLPINNLLISHIGFDSIIEKVVNKLGEIKKVILVGEFARGIDSNIIDLIFIGKDINKTYLIQLIDKVEKHIKRKIRYMVFMEDEFEEYEENNRKTESLVLYTEDELATSKRS